jgi:DNA helicase-2/ATP-dependent DNA helicase PcrA
VEKDLNGPQREAVLHGEGPLLILAGAGSGKTRVITYRIADLIARRGVRPWEILAVTFTNKAAGEMRERVAGLLGSGSAPSWIGTFHALCARLLRQHADVVGLPKSFVIVDDDDQRTVVSRVLREMNLSEKLFTPRTLLSEMDRAKNAGIGPEAYQETDPVKAGDPLAEVVARLYPRYQKLLHESGAVDFGDLLMLAVRLFDDAQLAERLASRFRHVLVDEFQDTNSIQFELLRRFTKGPGGHGNLCAVGDDDQSIYRWRGADLTHILHFENTFPDAHVVALEQNYRSTGTILDAAHAVISKNRGRRPKRLWTANEPGQPIALYQASNERDEAGHIVRSINALRAQGVALGEVALFYRTHAQSRVLEEELAAAHLPYTVIGGVRFYERTEIKDLLAYLRVIVQPSDSLDLARIINVPPRGIGKVTLERAVAHAEAHSMTLYDAIGALGRGEDPTLKASAQRPLAEVHALLEDLRQSAQGQLPSRVAAMVLERTGYRDRLMTAASERSLDGAEAESRMENLLELLGSMRAYEGQGGPAAGDELQPGAPASAGGPTLAGFLERVSLVNEVTENDGKDASERITLMTVHSAKGLEFDAVFLGGLEEGVFPHGRSRDDELALEEERRLCYVAVTRARRWLALSLARMRNLYGQTQVSTPSRFLADLPPELLQADTGSAAPFQRRPPARTGGAWLTGRPPVLSGRREPLRMPPPPAPPPRREGVWVDESYGQDRYGAGGDEGETVYQYGADTGSEGGEAGGGGDPYAVGRRVRHSQFGVGEVRATSGDGAHRRLVVRFPGIGEKTIVARFLLPC